MFYVIEVRCASGGKWKDTNIYIVYIKYIYEYVYIIYNIYTNTIFIHVYILLYSKEVKILWSSPFPFPRVNHL